MWPRRIACWLQLVAGAAIALPAIFFAATVHAEPGLSVVSQLALWSFPIAVGALDVGAALAARRARWPMLVLAIVVALIGPLAALPNWSIIGRATESDLGTWYFLVVVLALLAAVVLLAIAIARSSRATLPR